MSRPVSRTGPPDWLGEVWYVMRHMVASAFFAIAVLVVAAHVLARDLGVTGLGAALWAWSAVIVASACGLGWLCLPERPALPWRRPKATAGQPVGLPAADRTPGGPTDELISLERLWNRPTLLPPHEWSVRPAVPPLDTDLPDPR